MQPRKRMYRLRQERAGKPSTIVWIVREANGEVFYADGLERSQRSSAEFHRKFVRCE